MSGIFLKMRKESLWISIICLAVGVLFCVWPGATLIVLCRVIGIILIAAAVLLLGMALATHTVSGRTARLIPAVICLIIGIWMAGRPGAFVVVIPILIGVLMLYHGVKDLIYCLEVKRGNRTGWWIGLIFTILTVILGILLVFHAWLAIKIGMFFLGIVLIYDGVSGIVLNRRASQTRKGYHDDVIDVEYKEDR